MVRLIYNKNRKQITNKEDDFLDAKRKKEIEQLAENFCRKNNIFNYPVPIVKICEQNDIQVFEKYLPNQTSGFIVIQEEDFNNYKTGRLITINLSDTAARRRFTIAHELAHYVLHKSSNEKLYAHRNIGEVTEEEQEANLFASCILMPKSLIMAALKKLDEDFLGDVTSHAKIMFISSRFAVSRAAAEVRLKQLNFIV